MSFSPTGQLHIAGRQDLPKLAGPMIAALVLLLLGLTLILYLDARGADPAKRLEMLAGGSLGGYDLTFGSFMLTALSLLLRFLLFDDPDLDLMLVTPLTEPQIFWESLKRWLRPMLILGAATYLPFCGRLLGLGADVGLLVATTALWLGGFVLLLGAASLLALVSGIVCWLPLASAIIWSLSTGQVLTLAGVDALAGAMGWHPVASSLLWMVMACVLVFGLDHLLIGRFYTREALISRRDRPTPWWLARHQPDSGKDVGQGEGMGSGAWLVKRLDRQAHALWRLVQRDEAPEAFARRIPEAMALGIAWLIAAHWKLGGIEHSFQDMLMFGFFFVVVWLVALAILAMPSGRPRMSGQASAEPLAMVREPLQEIFPVDPRAYTAGIFCCGTFLITVSLLLFAPLAMLSPVPVATAARSLLMLWVVAELILGLVLFQVSPRISPRRPGLSWWWVATVPVAAILAVTAFLGFFFVVLADNEHAFWVLAASRELIHDHPVASFGFAALVVALLEMLVILASLRRHEKRGFDAGY